MRRLLRLRGIAIQMRSGREILRYRGAVRDKGCRLLSRRVAELKFHMNTLSGLRDARLCRYSPRGCARLLMNFYVTSAELNGKEKPHEDEWLTQRLEGMLFFFSFIIY